MQYIAFSPGVEVMGMLPLVNAIPEIKEDVLRLLAEEGLEEVGVRHFNHWHNQQKILNVLKLIEKKYGPATLFTMGKANFENSAFPLDITTMEAGLYAMNEAYQKHHRNGDAGYFKILEFDKSSRKGRIQCCNPYPSHFDRGIITGIMRHFRPQGAVVKVDLDTSVSNRLNGGDCDIFNVTW